MQLDDSITWARNGPECPLQWSLSTGSSSLQQQQQQVVVDGHTLASGAQFACFAAAKNYSSTTRQNRPSCRHLSLTAARWCRKIKRPRSARGHLLQSCCRVVQCGELCPLRFVRCASRALKCSQKHDERRGVYTRSERSSDRPVVLFACQSLSRLAAAAAHRLVPAV